MKGFYVNGAFVKSTIETELKVSYTAEWFLEYHFFYISYFIVVNAQKNFPCYTSFKQIK